MADRKTITTTIGKLVDAEPALQRLIALRLEPKTRYHAVKLAKLVSASTAAHFWEPRQQIIKDMGLEGPVVTAEKLPEFQTRLRPYVDVEETIEWGPLTSTMLEPYPEFVGADWLALGPLFELEEPAPPAEVTPAT